MLLASIRTSYDAGNEISKALEQYEGLVVVIWLVAEYNNSKAVNLVGERKSVIRVCVNLF